MLNKSCTTILAGFLVLSGAATAMAACGAGDLTGGWSMYGLAINPSAPFMMRCAVRLDKATTQPIAYSISGQCRLYSTTDPSEVFTASGTATLTESTACKLGGSFVLSTSGETETIDILDAKIESDSATSRKTHIEGLGRSTQGSYVALFKLSLVR